MLPDLPERSTGSKALRRLGGGAQEQDAVGRGLGPRLSSDSLCAGRKRTAVTFTGWKSRGRGPGRVEASVRPQRHKRAGPLLCNLSGELHKPESSLRAEQLREDSLGPTWSPGHTPSGLELLTLSPPRGLTTDWGHSLSLCGRRKAETTPLDQVIYKRTCISRQPPYIRGMETQEPGITGHAAFHHLRST